MDKSALCKATVAPISPNSKKSSPTTFVLATNPRPFLCLQYCYDAPCDTPAHQTRTFNLVGPVSVLLAAFNECFEMRDHYAISSSSPSRFWVFHAFVPLPRAVLLWNEALFRVLHTEY